MSMAIKDNKKSRTKNRGESGNAVPILLSVCLSCGILFLNFPYLHNNQYIVEDFHPSPGVSGCVQPELLWIRHPEARSRFVAKERFSFGPVRSWLAPLP